MTVVTVTREEEVTGGMIEIEEKQVTEGLENGRLKLVENRKIVVLDLDL